MNERGLLDCMCFNSRSTARAVTKFYDRALEPVELKITQFAILSFVRETGSPSMQALAACLNLDPSTMTRTLDPLVNAGYLRVEAGVDRRQREVVMTAKGHRTHKRAHTLWLAAQDGLRDKLGEERFSRVIGDMNALMEAVA